MTQWPVETQTLKTTRNTQNNKMQQAFRKQLFFWDFYGLFLF